MLRILCVPTKYHGENTDPEPRTLQKASSFRNLSSNEVRYKFREREKVKITFPAKPEANPTFDRDFVEVERYILRYAQSCSFHDGVVDDVVRYFSKLYKKLFISKR